MRSWELTPEGIGVWCQCEKGVRCMRNGLLLRPSSPDSIEAQLQAEIGLLRQEYQVPTNRVAFFYVLNNTPRPERRLLLRGRWKDEASLSIAREGFDKIGNRR
jgi:hypothetical protein